MSDNFLQNCKKIGIMGGTFNPIHIGHLLMAQYAKEFAGLDAVLFIPAGHPYMKAGSKILDGQTRLQMVRLAIGADDAFFASDIEIKRSGNTYTYETLQELSQIFPQADLYFIVGADNLFGLEYWVYPEKILKNCTLIAAARSGSGKEALESKRKELVEHFGGEILLMDFPAFDVSSTMIRERIKNGKNVRYMTPDKVIDYIETNGLYV